MAVGNDGKLAIEMQIRCVHCGVEQYGPAVWDISRGDVGCRWCGAKSRPMSTDEYREAHRRRLATGSPGKGASKNG